jgi:hypothetical protein
MSNTTQFIDEHDNRVAVITEIGIEVKALVLDERTREVTYANSPDAEKLLYAKAFQAWADGKIDGRAEDIFETVDEVLEI